MENWKSRDLKTSHPEFRSCKMKIWKIIFCLFFKGKCWDFPGGPVVKTLLPNAQGTGLISGKGAKISHAEWRGGKNKEASHQFTSIIKSGSEFQFSAQSLSHV